MSAIVIVGGGQAGLQTAVSLRDLGFDGPITVLGDEPALPYQRPPLSKAYLAGTTDDEGLALRPHAFFADRDIAMLTGERVVRIDRAAGRVEGSSGRLYPYAHLVLATGARNRTLPDEAGRFGNVLYLRTVADAARLRQALASARRAVVLGAGFIGLEFAAVAAKRGLEVTVVEMADRPMARALSAPMSAFFTAAHEGLGVRLRFGTSVAGVTGAGSEATAVRLSTGEELPADLVLVGIGVIPNAELARDAALPCAGGIEVDDTLLTGDPMISAVGDCAIHPSRFGVGVPLRIESVQNAIDQGRCVARRITGHPEPYAALPWFWSDQGPYKLQIVGLGAPGDEAVPRGDPAGGAFSVFRFRRDTLTAVESVNRPQDHMAARRFMAKGLAPSRAQAADAAFDLKALAQAASSV